MFSFSLARCSPPLVSVYRFCFAAGWFTEVMQKIRRDITRSLRPFYKPGIPLMLTSFSFLFPAQLILGKLPGDLDEAKNPERGKVPPPESDR